MIHIKVLKKFKDGLISHQILSETSHLEEPLYIDASYAYTANSLELYEGLIYYYLEDMKEVVFEVVDTFEPQTQIDIGGISVFSGDTVYNLYQYNDNTEQIKYNNIRVTKSINHYYGEGSEDGVIWYDKGRRFLQNADMLGVTYDTYHGVFPINEIKIYKSPVWRIYNIPESAVFELYNNGNLIYTTTVDDSESVKVKSSIYPAEYDVVVIYNSDVICSHRITDIWGGDEYYLSVDIDLFDKNMNPLIEDEFKCMGTFKDGGELVNLIYAVNNSVATNITIRISTLSPAYDWVELEYQGTIGKEISFYLDGTDSFNIIINHPDGAPVTNTDEKYWFYLEVL